MPELLLELPHDGHRILEGIVACLEGTGVGSLGGHDGGDSWRQWSDTSPETPERGHAAPWRSRIHYGPENQLPRNRPVTCGANLSCACLSALHYLPHSSTPAYCQLSSCSLGMLHAYSVHWTGCVSALPSGSALGEPAAGSRKGARLSGVSAMSASSPRLCWGLLQAKFRISHTLTSVIPFKSAALVPSHSTMTLR